MNTQTIYNLAVAGVQQLIPYPPGKPMSELQRELGLKRIIKLASNENPVGPGPKVLEAIQQTMPELSRYPDGSGFELKAALGKKLQLANDQITLGNGSNEILELVARTFLTPSSEVIISQHAFAVYPLVAQSIGAIIKFVPAINYGHDLTSMLAQVNSNTRMIFIANPNNPTGTYLPHCELERFLQALPKEVICILDEAYYEYVHQEDYPESIPWLQKYPNLLITRTFSKAYGLAGLRVGYGLSSPEMADLLNRVRQPFNNNRLALAAAEAALDDTQYIQETLSINNQGMQFLTDSFSQLGLNWIPSVANFVTVDMQRPAQPVYEELLQKGVIVRPVANYGLAQHLRVSIGTAEENQVFIDALTEIQADVQ